MKIETRSIDYIPLAERHGKVRDVWPVWFSGGAQLGTVATGMVGVELGLDLAWSIVALLLGSALGTLFMALHSTQGPQLGLPQMIQSRPQFGRHGALLVWVVALVTYTGFNAFGPVLAAQTVRQIFGLEPTLVIVLFTAGSIALAVFGYDSIHSAQRWLAYALVSCMVVFCAGVGFLHVPLGDLSVASFHAVPFLMQLFASTAYQLSWSIYVSDYSRYLPPDVRPLRSFLSTYFGCWTGGAWMMGVGAVVAALNPHAEVAFAVQRSGDGIFNGFGTMLLLAALAGLLTTTSLNFYGASLTLLSAIDTVKPIQCTRRARVMSLLGAGTAATTAALFLKGDYVSSFKDLLTILLYLFTPWTSINLVDFFLVRHGRYSIREIFNVNGIYGHWNWRGLTAYAVGFAGMIPFFSTGFYMGPIARWIQGADVAMLVGLPIAAITYLIACRSLDLETERRQVASADRDLEPGPAIRWRRLACLFVVLPLTGGGVPEVAHAREAAKAEWLSYGGDAAQNRFSPLAAISPKTIQRLGLQWALDLPNETNLVATPLMANGLLYFPGKFSVVYAVEARTGKIAWVFDPKAREALARTPRRMSYNWGTSRGVAYWKGTIIVATADGRLISLDAKTGRSSWSVQTIDATTAYLYITGAPLVFGDRVLIGNAGGDFGPSRGYVTAYSAVDGKELWRTFTVPGDPARGYESEAMKLAARTWGPQWWKTSGGGNVWNAMTFDPELNRVYIGTGNGSPWNQTIRGRAGGDNLFVASIIALDADTGKYVWHYQTVPGDNWDYDATEDLVLADVRIGAMPRKVLMQAGKNGFFYVIDRAGGKLISAEKFAHVTWAERVDLKTGRPVEAPGMRPSGLDSPAMTVWPWENGAHAWPSMSFNPRTGLVYIPGMDGKQIYDARGIDPNTYEPGGVEMWTGYSDVVGRDPAAPQASGDTFKQGAWLKAWDPRTNREAWKVEQPGLFAGGTLTTAGGLVFIGQANGDLAAYDASTGEKLWHLNCGRPISASPISYAIDGAQYIAVLVGWGGDPAIEGFMSEPGGMRMSYRDGGRGLFVFALDGKATPPVHAVAKVVPIDIPEFRPDGNKVKRGEHLFDNNCNYCHGTDALSGGQAPDLRASPLAADRKTLGEVVLGGMLEPRGMPKYPDFSNDDIDAIYHYIRWRARTDLQHQPSR